ncbi:MAG: glycoside hydrolase family 3 N-terminal domain-containing protein [Solirubrobacteraceae bacterium]
MLVLVLTSSGASHKPRRRSALPRQTAKLVAVSTPNQNTTRLTATTRSTAKPHPRSAGSQHRRSRHDIDRMLGQTIVARFQGPQPSPAFLQRIRRGEIGGVILFADNVAAGIAHTRALTTELQNAARQGGNPPLLIMTDQEGGTVHRLPGAPYLAASAMRSGDLAFKQGLATGRLLRAAGVNVDLAPVADVERAPGSFLGKRAFGSSSAVVADRACAFAVGLQSQGVAYTLKHFPGLGRATTSTDNGPVAIGAPASLIRADYLPYVSCGSEPLALVMVSSAAYPSLSGPLPAVMSRAIYQRELRIIDPQAPPLTISDDLQAAALARQPSPTERAVGAGLDLLLYAQTEKASADAYQALLTDVHDADISLLRLARAEHAIHALKQALKIR